MQVNTFRNYNYTADLYHRTEEVDFAGNISYRHDLEGSIDCKVFYDNTGRLFLHYPTALQMGDRITNIRDSRGNLLVEAFENPLGFAYDIASVDPITNAWGDREAFRYTLAEVR